MSGTALHRPPELPPGAVASEVFRPPRWLRYTVVAAIAAWIFILGCLVALHSSTGRAFLGVAFFLTLFSALAVFYNNTSIEVTVEGVIMRGVRSFRLVRFADILKVDVTPGFLQTVYAVRARRGVVSFTSLLANHQRLFQLIIERAHLSPTAVA